MTARDKIQDLFTPSGCLSNRGLSRYIEGSLAPEEKRLAGLHIDNCELCADAVSGYRQHAHPDNVMPGIHDLNRQLHQRFLKIHQKTRTERSMVSVFSVAATVILLAGIFLLLKQREMVNERFLAQSRHDSVLFPGGQILAPDAGPENEISARPIKKPVTAKEKKPGEKKSAADLNLEENQDDRAGEIVFAEVDEMSVLSDEEQMRTTEEVIPEIITDSVIIIKSLVDWESRSKASGASVRNVRKTTSVKVEPVAAEQSVMKSEEILQEDVFIVVEEMPRFMDADIHRFLQFVRENLVYPAEAAEAGIEGRVMIKFVVNETGKPTDIRIVRSADPLIDAEALRVIASSPSWKPGMQHGKPVKVSFTVPIVFSLQE